MKIRTRFFMTAVLLLAGGLYWLVDWIVQDVRFHYFITMEESMVDTSVILASQLSLQVDEGTVVVNEAFRKAWADAEKRNFSALIYNIPKTQMNLRVLVMDRRGIVMYDSKGACEGEDFSTWRDVSLTLNGEYGARATCRNTEDQKSIDFFISAPIEVEGEILGVVSVCKPVSSISTFMQQARNRLIVSGLIAFVAVLLLLIPISLWVIHPIRKLTVYARGVRDGQKVDPPRLGGGEIAELADAFEEMRDTLEGHHYVEEYVQSLTHEMKSPLAAIQGAAELMDEEMSEEQRRRFLKNIRTESARIYALVDRLLDLAAVEKRKTLVSVESIAGAALVQDVLEGLLPQIQSKACSVNVVCDDSLQVKGEYFLLRQALSNLLLNAVEFSPKGGLLNVCVERVDERVSFCVLDEGLGIPDYAKDRLFERFYSLPRPDSGKKSSGLGLNFVREVATLHGGTIELADRDPCGTKACLTIPD